MGAPWLTVVIPILDEEAALPDCLASITAQREHSLTIELIVVDGGSRDRGPALATGAGAQLLTAPRGRGSQLRAGAEAARGELLLFLHADVQLPQGAFAAIEAAAREADFGAGAFALTHHPSAQAGRWTRACLRLADRRSRRRHLPYGDQALFLRRRLYHEVGGIPPRPLLEDIAFARRLAARTPILRLPLAVTASARRFESRPLRTTLCWWTFPTLDRLGLSPQLLARLYG